MTEVSTYVQPVDTCRVEIKESASGAIQISTRATDKATYDEADRAVRLAVKMFNDTKEKLEEE